MADTTQKVPKVFSPDLDSSREEKDAFIEILDKAIAEGEEGIVPEGAEVTEI